ncbi:MAG: hypothetical protein IJ563_07635 [Selenomonadaceae bacterium]|nr:hypothetical protein [Selenomonadaceae bacterium]
MKVLIFGAGERGIKLYNYLQKHSDEYQVIAFLDNNAEKITKKSGGGGGDAHSDPETRKSLRNGI